MLIEDGPVVHVIDNALDSRDKFGKDLVLKYFLFGVNGEKFWQ